MQRNKCETGRNQIKAGGEVRRRRRWREELSNESQARGGRISPRVNKEGRNKRKMDGAGRVDGKLGRKSGSMEGCEKR